jgi:hypothetical protein
MFAVGCNVTSYNHNIVLKLSEHAYYKDRIQCFNFIKSDFLLLKVKGKVIPVLN